MTVVTIQQAKANLSKLIRKAAQGEQVIIAKGPKHVARLVPVGEAGIKGKRKSGSLKGKLHVGPEFQPVPIRGEGLSATVSRDRR